MLRKRTLLWLTVTLFALHAATAFTMGGEASAQISPPSIPRLPKTPKLPRVETSDRALPTDLLHDRKASDYVKSIITKVTPEDASNEYFIDIYKTSWVQGLSYFDGWLVITRGMLNVVVNEAELACLLGHEIAHQEKEHMERRVTGRRQSAELRRMLGQVSGRIPQNAILREMMDDIAANGWSKKLEEEADFAGAILCAEAGYDPHAFADLFDRLGALAEGAPGSAKTYKKTHRSLKKRATRLRSFLEREGYSRFTSQRGYRTYVRSLSSIASIRTKTPGGVDSPDQFMAEEINQDEPLWDQDAIDQIDADAQAATHRFLNDQCDADNAGGDGQIDSRDYDAFGHCWYGCEATKRFGWDETYIAGTGRELYRELQSIFGFSGHDSFSQDINNQEHGRREALNNPYADCYDRCRILYNFGALDLSAPGRIYYSCATNG